MTISKIINDYGQKHSPYIGGLVNHLPMGQLAFYKITDNLGMVKSYSEKFVEDTNINLVETEYPNKKFLKECLGKRNLYEPCLKIIQEKTKKQNIDDLIRQVLNDYKLGMSSGLFHTIIRLAYAVEGYKLDENLSEEIERALAYYVTAYREADLFTREIQGEDFLEEIKLISENEDIHKLIIEENSLGKRIRALYEDDLYLELGFVIQSSNEEKIYSLLNSLVKTYINYGNIVILHCITGLHALIVLEEYFDDFSESIDIMTTCIVTHILAINEKQFRDTYKEKTELSWECILAKSLETTDVHALKLAYTAYELSKLYDVPNLKDIAFKRIKHK